MSLPSHPLPRLPLGHRAGLLAAWGSAFLTGRAGYDQVLAAVTGELTHRVSGLPGSAAEVPLGWALSGWRERGATALRLVLPIPGDPRGLPGPSAFGTAAMAAGEAVHGAGLGLVPELARHGSAVGSAAWSVCWQAYPEMAEPAADPLSVAEAEHDLTVALRAAASTLADLDRASWQPELAADLSRARQVGAPTLPPGHPPRAVRLLAQADRLGAMLQLADAHVRDAAAKRGVGPEAHAAYRALWTAIRRARLAGYNA